MISAFFLISTFAFSAQCFAGDQVDVENSNAGKITVTITGKQGSKAEMLYNSLTGIEVSGGSAMAGRIDESKTGKAIDCTRFSQHDILDRYQCTFSVAPNGDSLAPFDQ